MEAPSWSGKLSGRDVPVAKRWQKIVYLSVSF